MSTLSSLLVTLGLLSLIHAAYSAHEFSSLSTKLHHGGSASASSSAVTANLPLDIKLETLTSIFLTCFGLVLGADRLKPISWSSWAGEVEKEGGGANPFRTLEDRVGFMDIRAKRKEFADWAKGQGGVGSKN